MSESSPKDFSQFLHPEVAELFDEHFVKQAEEIARLTKLVVSLQDTNDFIFNMIDDVYKEIKELKLAQISPQKPIGFFEWITKRLL